MTAEGLVELGSRTAANLRLMLSPDCSLLPSLHSVEQTTASFIMTSSSTQEGAAEAAPLSAPPLVKSNPRLSAFLQRTIRAIGEARASTPQQVISKLLFYLADVMGDSLGSRDRYRLRRAVSDAVQQSQMDCSVTGVVLSYREREDRLPWNVHRRIQRMLHYASARLPAAACRRVARSVL